MEKMLPPFVCYEVRAVEDRAASIEAGHYVSRDVDYVVVMQRGGKDKTEKPYSDWIVLQRQMANEGRIPMEWLDTYERAYEAWKRNETIPEEGTPIKNWCVPTPAQVRIMVSMGITTVEQLAACTTEAIKRLGMGGLALKQQAVDYLAASTDSGKLVKELAAERSSRLAAEDRIKAMEVQLAELVQKLNAGSTAAPTDIKPSAQFKL